MVACKPVEAFLKRNLGKKENGKLEERVRFSPSALVHPNINK